MNETADLNPQDPTALAQNLRDIRERGEAQWLTYMAELQERGREIKARLGSLFVGVGDGMVIPAEHEAEARELMRQAGIHRETFVLTAVKGAIITGRIPDEREDEAWERCADDDGLWGFLDEMSKVPVGFVDTYVPPARAN